MSVLRPGVAGMGRGTGAFVLEDVSLGEEAADVTPNSDVLIVGAGIAGLGLARALRRQDIPVLTLDRRSEAADQGLAINLPGNAIQALQALGVGDEIEAFGRPVLRREYRSDAGRLLFAMDEAAFWGPKRLSRCLRRGDLMSLLRTGLPSDAILSGRSVSSVLDDDGGVTVHTLDGEAFGARLLIGADGVHSKVRQLRLDGRAPASARIASSSRRFMVPDPGVACWTVWVGPDAMVLLVPVDGGEVYGWAVLTRADAKDEPGALQDAVRHFPEPVRIAVDAALSAQAGLHHSPLDEVRLPRWSVGRTILIGDAAHATAPVWAQGAALGLEDALVLAHLLGQGREWITVPSEFERLRRPRVEHVQTMTDRMSKGAAMPVALRNLLVPFLGPRSYKRTYGPLKESVLPEPAGRSRPDGT